MKKCLISICFGLFFSFSSYAFTVLNADQYQQTIHSARAKVKHLLASFTASRNTSLNSQVALITTQLADIPYLSEQSMGEGDWQANSFTYQPHAVHVQQSPVYRLDGLDCQTFVQVTMGLLYSRTLPEFEQNMLKIAYGAAGNPAGEIVRYYNRNNFIEGDFNPINEKNGWLKEVTSVGELASYAQYTQALLTRQRWFLYQQQEENAINVLYAKDGHAMENRFHSLYTHLPFPRFQAETISIAYLPKETLVIKQGNGSYVPNQMLLDKIPTPAIVEIVRDAKKWSMYGMNVKQALGTELTISHFGILYRKIFHDGEVIYQRIACDENDNHEKHCEVQPVRCQKKVCNELMFAHATDSHPDQFYWYQDVSKNFHCTADLPANTTHFSRCNRVEQLPLFAYLSDYQYGYHWYMDTPSILGVHIEALVSSG